MKIGIVMMWCRLLVVLIVFVLLGVVVVLLVELLVIGVLDLCVVSEVVRMVGLVVKLMGDYLDLYLEIN